MKALRSLRLPVVEICKHLTILQNKFVLWVPRDITCAHSNHKQGVKLKPNSLDVQVSHHLSLLLTVMISAQRLSQTLQHTLLYCPVEPLRLLLHPSYPWTHHHKCQAKSTIRVAFSIQHGSSYLGVILFVGKLGPWDAKKWDEMRKSG